MGDGFGISAVVLGELRFGIALMRNQSRHAELTAWYARLLANFGHVALPVTAAVSELWDGPGAAARRAGRALDAPDDLIAATALVHDLTPRTRNTRDFGGTGVRVFNPREDG